MNRRTFLTTLTAAAAGFALDPEQLLWVPGRKTIFLPTAKQAEFFATGCTVGGITPERFMWWRNANILTVQFYDVNKIQTRLEAYEIPIPLRLQPT